MSDILVQPESRLLRLPGELRNKIYGYFFSTTVPEYPSPIVERDLKFKNITAPYRQNPDRKDFNLRLAITQTCHQISTETRLLPYIHAKYKINGWVVWWLMVLDDDARVTLWNTFMWTEQDSVKLLYNDMRGFYDRIVVYSHFNALFDKLRGSFDSFLNQAN